VACLGKSTRINEKQRKLTRINGNQHGQATVGKIETIVDSHTSRVDLFSTPTAAPGIHPPYDFSRTLSVSFYRLSQEPRSFRVLFLLLLLFLRSPKQRRASRRNTCILTSKLPCRALREISRDIRYSRVNALFVTNSDVNSNDATTWALRDKHL
jgi:hypothetical protein